MTLGIRKAVAADEEAIWAILEPVIRAGETYALDPAMSREDALSYWLGADRSTWVACTAEGEIVGTYYLRANQAGGGAHVANCGYMVASGTHGKGVGRTMARHSLDEARHAGFSAMQFNFVIASNTRAIALWEELGFATLARVPDAFIHPHKGPVDALVMHRRL